MRKRTGLNILVIALAIAFGLYLSRKPWTVYHEQQQKANQATREMHEAEKSREELLKQAASIESPLGRETAVRKAGYTKPGETPASKE
jgi:cell division protein FtsB